MINKGRTPVLSLRVTRLKGQLKFSKMCTIKKIDLDRSTVPDLETDWQ